jgi:HPt (histidine-containing phosphotransfer) domain-containing protein
MSRSPKSRARGRDLDPSCLAALASVLPAQSLHDYVALYLTGTDERIAGLAAAIAAGDHAAAAREAHVLVGTSGSVGATELCARARALEMLCRNGAASDEAARQAAAIAAAVERSSAALRRWLEAQGAAAPERG